MPGGPGSRAREGEGAQPCAEDSTIQSGCWCHSGQWNVAVAQASRALWPQNDYLHASHPQQAGVLTDSRLGLSTRFPGTQHWA